jgi:ubiquinone/menaquinone biosynthesis C-methylase UbiE
MKINFQETTTDLQTRIDIHTKYGNRDIDQWMLELIPIKKGMKILDIGCGAGKQCFSYYKKLEGDCEIYGTDVSTDLLDQAKERNQAFNNAVKFSELDFNKKFPFEDNTFDFASCCFAIYYAEDIPFTISEIHRVLKPGGTLFTTGPMPENKQLFYEIIVDATNAVIPPMPGSSRYSSEIFSTIEKIFSKAENNIFENPLTFDSPEPFLQYTRASISEDRRLWNDIFTKEQDFETVMKKITASAQKRFEKDGNLVMKKVVGGFIATK